MFKLIIIWKLKNVLGNIFVIDECIYFYAYTPKEYSTPTTYWIKNIKNYMNINELTPSGNCSENSNKLQLIKYFNFSFANPESGILFKMSRPYLTI